MYINLRQKSWGHPEIFVVVFSFKFLKILMVLHKMVHKAFRIQRTLPGVSIKSWHFWIVCQLKTETFWGNFHKYVWLKVSSIIWHQNIWKYFMLEWVLATFVKGMKIRLRKSRLSVLAEWKAPQRRNCRSCDEFMINSDGYWLYCVRHGSSKQNFMNKWACMTFLITNGLWKSC